jgi:UDP-glucose 4-epimerase
VKVLVTGGAGFIGANVCAALTKAGVDNVVAFDNLSSGFRQNLENIGASLVEADLLDLDAVSAAASGATSIVHLGARPSVPRSIADPLASHHANVTGTMHVLEAARAASVNHVVVASSSSVYGSNPTLPKSEGLKPSPQSPYAAAKLAAEVAALAYKPSFGIDVLAFRFFNVFGPLQAAGHAYAAVIPAFIDAALAGKPLQIYGDGEQSRDFTFVASVAAIITRAVLGGVSSLEPVNLAFGSRVTLLEVVGMLERQLGVDLKREHLPERRGDVRHSQADQTRLRSLFPDLAPVDLETGLAATVHWFRHGCGPLG